MKKILILRDVQQYQAEIEKIAQDWEVIITTDKETTRKFILDAEIIAGWNGEVAKIIENPDAKFKWIQNFSAGVDDMPLAKLKERGTVLTCGSGVHPKQLSETIFASMLALARRVPDWVKFQEKSSWEQKRLWQSDFEEIHGKTIGILGVGEIGQEVAKIAKAFSMYTLGLRRSKKDTPYVDEMYTMEDLYTMISRCDYLINILPLTEETRGIIDKKVFDSMSAGARYFNFGRGESTNTNDMIEALKSGKLAAAGIDVIDPEPLGPDSPLWKMENVLISPHVGGATPNYTKRVMEIFLENIKEYVNDEPVTHSRIDYNLGY